MNNITYLYTNMKNDRLTTPDDFIDAEYGIKGTPKRAKFEQGYQEFKLGAMLQEEQIAKKITKSHGRKSLN